MADFIGIHYPNGSVEGVQVFIWDGSKPTLWDGSITVSTSGGPIQDGVSAAIKATVLDLSSSNPLTVGIVDGNGDQITSFGGGTQYTNGASTPANPVGTMPVYDNAGTISKVGMSNGLPVQIRATNVTQPISGSVTANAGTNLNTSALALESGGNLATLAGVVSSARAAVNPISGQSGVTGGSGTVGAATQRVVLATDVALPAGTNNIGLVTAGHGKTIKSASGSFTSDTDVIAAVSSKRIKVIALKIETFGTSATTVLWKSNGTGGTEVWRSIAQAITGTISGETQSVPAPSFLFATVAGEKLTADTNTGDTIHYSITYFDDDAT